MNSATKTETGSLAVAGQQQDQPLAHVTGQALTLDSVHLSNMVTVAKMMASGRSTVPQHLRGNEGDCLAITMQAVRWGMDPFAVAGKTHLVNGSLGYEAQLVASVVNSSNITKDRMHFSWFGPWEKIVGRFKKVESRTKKDDDGNFKSYIVPAWEPKDEEGLGIEVWATLRGETEPRKLTLLMAQARTRNSTLWTEDPKQQIAYLAQKRWARLYAPDVLLGVYTPDELEERAPRDMGPVVEEKPVVPPELLADAKIATGKGVAAYQKFWMGIGVKNRKLLGSMHEQNKEIAERSDKERTLENQAASAAAVPAASAQPAATNATSATGGGLAQQAAGAPRVTYAIVMDKLLAAKNRDALDVACDWIGEVDDPGQRVELSAKYEELCNKFTQ